MVLSDSEQSESSSFIDTTEPRKRSSSSKRKKKSAFSSDDDDGVLEDIAERFGQKKKPPPDRNPLPKSHLSSSSSSSSSSSDDDDPSKMDTQIEKRRRKAASSPTQNPIRPAQHEKQTTDVDDDAGCDGDSESSVDTMVLARRIQQQSRKGPTKLLQRQKSDSSLDTTNSLLLPRLRVANTREHKPEGTFSPSGSRDQPLVLPDENIPPSIENNGAEEVWNDNFSIVNNEDEDSVSTAELARRIRNPHEPRKAREKVVAPLKEFFLPDQLSSSDEDDDDGQQQQQDGLVSQQVLAPQHQPQTGLVPQYQQQESAGLPSQPGNPQQQQEAPVLPAISNPYLRKAKLFAGFGSGPSNQGNGAGVKEAGQANHHSVVVHDGLRKPPPRFASPKVAPRADTTPDVEDIQDSDDDGAVFGFGRAVTAAIERRKRDSVAVFSGNTSARKRHDTGHQGSFGWHDEQNEYNTSYHGPGGEASWNNSTSPRREFGHGVPQAMPSQQEPDFVLTSSAHDPRDYERAASFTTAQSNNYGQGSFGPVPYDTPRAQLFQENNNTFESHDEYHPQPIETNHHPRNGESAFMERGSTLHEQGYPPPHLPVPSFQTEDDYIEHHENPIQNYPPHDFAAHEQYQEQNIQAYAAHEQQYELPEQHFQQQDYAAHEQQYEIPAQHVQQQDFAHHDQPDYMIQHQTHGGLSNSVPYHAPNSSFGETGMESNAEPDFTLESAAHCEVDYSRFRTEAPKAAFGTKGKQPRIRDAKGRKRMPRRGKKGKRRGKAKSSAPARLRQTTGKSAAAGDDPHLRGVGGAQITF